MIRPYAGILLAGFLILAAGKARAADSGVSISTSVFVTGDTMQILEHGLKTKFIGNVKIVSWEGDIVWEAYGNEGLYNSTDNTMTVWDTPPRRARLIRHPRSQPDLITLQVYGYSLKTDSSMTFFHAEGNSYGIDISTTTHQFLRFWAEKADYNQALALIRLDGARPLIIIDKPTERRTLTGTKIRYLLNEHRLIAEGDAVSKILPGPHSFQ